MTPQAALESFFYYTEASKYDQAAHLLDLRELPASEQATEGARLSERLQQILDRKVVIRWGDVVDRPDGLNALGSNKNPMAGKPRRSIRLERLNLVKRPVSIRLHRVKPKGEEPVWVFSPQTVQSIDELYDY